MTQVTFQNTPITLVGNLPSVHEKARNFSLVDKDLQEKTLIELAPKKLLLSTLPSLDTGVCTKMAKHIDLLAKKHRDCLFLIISMDLPFAQKRFCFSENVHNILMLSAFRSPEFGQHYGLLIFDGPLKGLLARALFVLDEKRHILYRELCPEISEEPHYHKAAEFL